MYLGQKLALFSFVLFFIILGIIDESFAISSVTLNPPENAIQWASLEIQLNDPSLDGTVKVKSVDPNGSVRDDHLVTSPLRLLHDSTDPTGIFHGKIMLSNPNKVGSTPEILENISVQPGDIIYVWQDQNDEKLIQVVAQGTHYPNGTRYVVTEKLYNNGCTDRDEDQICDEWENHPDGYELKISHNSVEYVYYCDGPNVKDATLIPKTCSNERPDIFLELDWMEGHHPDTRAIKKVVESFDQRGINLHIQINESPAILHNPVLGFPGYEIENSPQYNGFDQLKGNQFGTDEERRRYGSNPSGIPNEGALIDAVRDLKHQVFHYGVFNHERQWAVGESGIGETNGNDFMISLGSFSGFVGSADQQAGTLMHELGHNLGLLHGGGDSINYKPNYFSVMNHARQMTDFDSNRKLDFSGKVLGINGITNGFLNEDDLREQPIGLDEYAETIDHTGEKIIFFCNSGAQAGLYYTPGGKVNWNCNSKWDTGKVTQNINNFAGTGTPDEKILNGYNDMSNLNYYFVESSDYEDGVHHNDGKGIAGMDPDANDRNPIGTPPGLRNYPQNHDDRFDFVSQENEISNRDLISHRIEALLAITHELAQSNNPDFVPIRKVSNNEKSSEPKIIFTQFLPGDNLSGNIGLSFTSIPDKVFEEKVGQKGPEALAIHYLFWQIEKAIESTNHHDLAKTKELLKLIDKNSSQYLDEERSKIISSLLNNQIKSIESALDFTSTDFHSEGHRPSSEPIIDPSEVTDMIHAVYADNNMTVCPEGFQGAFPICNPIPDGGKRDPLSLELLLLIVMMILIIAIVLAVAFFKK